MFLCVAVLAGLATLALLFKPFFREFESFQDWLDVAFRPDLLAWVSSDLDLWVELKLFAWSMCGLIVGAAVYVGVRTLFG